jgi:hypothetical protein
MPGPMFWAALTFGAVVLCTAHLCLGFALGRKTGIQRTTTEVRSVLTKGLAQVTTQEAAVERLIGELQELAALCTQSMPPRDSVARAVEDAVTASVALREATRATVEHHRQAILQCAPKDTAKTNATVLPGSGTRGQAISDLSNGPIPSAVRENTGSGVDGQQRQRSTQELQTEPDTLSSRAHAFVQADSSLDTRMHSDCPAGHLTRDEVERFRTSEAPIRASQTTEVRYPYNAEQYCAAVFGKEFPAPQDFSPVQCRDLSKGGISFFSDADVPVDEVIITLGSPPELTFWKARVAHQRAAVADGRTGYTVGCAFIARIAPGVYGWNAERACVEAGSGEQSTDAMPVALVAG